MEETEVTHSTPLTNEVATSIRDLLREDDEGELDPYDALNKSGTKVSFKLTNTETELQYMVTVEPVGD